MRAIVQAIDEKTEIYKALPLFDFLRDKSIDPAKRLAFAPSVAHYVITFGDLCKQVLREEPAKDKLQEIVNAQTYEEGEHWRWFISDLGKLGHDPQVKFSDALNFLWSDATAKSRMLSYQICRLALGADSLRKMVVVHVAEATANVTVKGVVEVGKEWTAQTGVKLAFFGGGHDEAEDDHTLWDEQILALLKDITLEPAAREELLNVVDQAFHYFTEFTNELLAMAQSERKLRAA